MSILHTPLDQSVGTELMVMSHVQFELELLYSDKDDVHSCQVHQHFGYLWGQYGSESNTTAECLIVMCPDSLLLAPK